MVMMNDDDERVSGEEVTASRCCVGNVSGKCKLCVMQIGNVNWCVL